MNTLRSQSILACALVGLAACSSTTEKNAPQVDSAFFESNGSMNPDGSFSQDLRFESMLQVVASSPFASELTKGQPITVLAVTDDALESFNGEESMTRQQIDSMVGIHLIPGDFNAENLASQTFVTTLGGQRLTVHDWNGRLELQSEGELGRRSEPVELLETDLTYGPLRIHVLERPLEATGETLGEMLQASGAFDRLLTAIEAAGLTPILDSAGPFTIFAPSDAAMGQLEPKIVRALMNPANRPQLVQILQRHVIAGRFYSDDFHVTELSTSNNDTLELSWSKGEFKVNGAGFVATDLEATNGVMHVVDRLFYN